MVVSPFLKDPVNRIEMHLDAYNQEVPKLEVKIPKESREKLDLTIELAKKYGRGYRVHPDNPRYVKGKILINKNKYKCKLKVKGGIPTHYNNEENKVSLKFKLKDSLYRGMSKFSIYYPNVRNQLNEWLFHKMNKHFGLIAHQFEFIEYIENEKSLGIFALEEVISEELLNRNQRLLGPVLKFDSDYVWEQSKDIEVSPSIKDFFNEAKIVLHNDNSFSNSKKDSLLIKNAIKALEDLRNRNVKASEVLDIKKWAKLTAIIDFFGEPHGLGLWNLRFYYNPTTKLIEPIPYDQSNIKPKAKYYLDLNPIFGESQFTDTILPKHENTFIKKMFSDRIFYQEYISALNAISAPSFLENFIDSIKPEMESCIRILKKEIEYSNYDFNVELDILRKNAKFINQSINPSNAIHAYKEDNHIYLSNYLHFPILITSIKSNDKNLVEPSKKILLQAHKNNYRMNYTNIVVSENIDNSTVTVEYKVLGSGQVLKTKAVKHELPLKEVTDSTNVKTISLLK